MNRTHAIHPRWWELEGDQLANEVVAIADGLETDQRPRADRYLQMTSLYECKPLRWLNAAAYDLAPQYYEDIYVPLCRSLCDSAQADIAGRQRPMPFFQTIGADWHTRRRAKKLTRFVEACLNMPQDSYVNAWEQTCDVFLDAEICGVGVCKVFVDADAKLCIERVQPGRLKIDPREAAAGNPLNYFDKYLADEDKLIATYCDDQELDLTQEERDSLRAKIMSAASMDDSANIQEYGTTRIARSVQVREAWRMPISSKKPGKHAICISGAVLFEEEWTRKTSPFVVFRWSREREGFWGTGLIEESKSVVAEFNRVFERLQARHVLSSGQRTYYKQDTIEEKFLEANDDEVMIPYTGDQPPITIKGEPVSPQDISYLTLVRQLAFETPGISQMSATSRKEQDVTAGVAIRTLIDLASKRFAVKARYGYEYPFVELAKAIVAACSEFYEREGRDVVVPLPQQGSAQQIKWSEAELDLERVVVQLQPVSTLSSELPGIEQTVQELFSAGLIPQQVYFKLLDWPDLDEELARQRAEYEFVEDVIERYLDAKDLEEANYQPPDGWGLSKPQTLVQVAQKYFQARREGAPEFNLQLLRRYMMQLTEAIQRAQQPPPGAAGPGMPAAPPAPAPGSPPLGPTQQQAA